MMQCSLAEVLYPCILPTPDASAPWVLPRSSKAEVSCPGWGYTTYADAKPEWVCWCGREIEVGEMC